MVTAGDFPAADAAAATETCNLGGVAPGPQFDACVLDVLVTGDHRLVEAAALVTDVLVSADAVGLDPTGRIEVDFEGSIPPNFVAARYSHDPATSRIAGPLFDTTGYRAYLRDIGRHDGARIEADLYAFGRITEDTAAQRLQLVVNKQARGSILLDGGPPRLADGLEGTIEVTATGTTELGQAFTRYRLGVDLGAVGESIDVELKASGFRGVSDTSFGLDDLLVALDMPPADEFAVEVPLTVPGPPGSGTHGSDGAGILESGGAADVFRFDVQGDGEAKAYVVNTLECSAPLTYLLHRTGTGELAGRWADTCGRVTTDPLAPGEYTLMVTPFASRAPAEYSAELFALPAPQAFDLPLATLVRDGEPLEGAGNLETVASIDEYSFQTSGETLFFDQRACFPGQQWVLRATATDAQLASGRCEDRELANLQAGTYTLSVLSTSTAGGTYSFQLFPTPVPPQDFATSLPLTAGEGWPAAGAGTLETQQSVDRYPFTLEPGTPVAVDLVRCLDEGQLRWALRALANEDVVASGGCADAETPSLPAGDYQLEVSSTDQGRGSYEIHTWSVPLAPQTFDVEVPAVISAGRPAAGAGHLETKASTDVYRFTLAEPETEVYVDDISCPTADMLRWEIVHDVEGVPVTVANGGCEDSGTVRQLGRGEYRLVVSAVGDVRGTYGLRIVASHAGSPEMLHVPVATAYHAKPIPIELTTVCEHPEACSARLHYRTSRYEDADGNVLVTGNWTERDMELESTVTVDGRVLHRWIAEVPGTAVTTTGIDYYLTAADGDDRNELPVGTATPLGFGGEPTEWGVEVAETPYFHVTTVSPPLVTHVSPVFAQADTDLPLELRATCSTEMCTARLHYRTSAGLAPGTSELLGEPGWSTITMSATASTDIGETGDAITYRAVIPGAEVDTRGLDYYFDVADSYTTTWWPGTTYQGYYAPQDGMRTGYQTIHVLEPPHIVHQPVMTTPYRADTPIAATSNCPATRMCTARLYYRTTAVTGNAINDSLLTEHDFVEVPMTVVRIAGANGNDVISVSAIIPGSYADTRGIDYFFRVDDGSTTTWFPGTGQVQGYVNVDGTRVAYQHIRVIEAPHITPVPVLATKALEPYTITAKMTCVTETCSLTLHWRNDLAPGEPDTGWHEAEMATVGSPVETPLGPQYTYTYTIPAEKVTTRGLAYFLEGYDGYVHDYAPGTSYWGAYLPLDGQHVDASVDLNGDTTVVGSFIVRVLEPPHLVHVPPGAVPRGMPLPITASSNCSSPQCTASLTWTDRNGVTQSVGMRTVRKLEGSTLSPAVPGDLWEYTAVIPGLDTMRTVQYAISVSDGYTGDQTPTLSAQVY